MPIRKLRPKYESDYMSRIMDTRLERLEDDLTALYANSTYEVLEKYTKWIDKYRKQDDLMQAKIESGEISEEEWLEWRRRRLLNSKIYKDTIKSLTDVLVNTDIAAMAAVSGELPLVIAESYNFIQSLGFDAADQAGMSIGTFQIYNADSVQKILKDNPDILPSVDVPEDIKWNRDHINREITQGIITGDSIPDIEKRLMRVTNMDEDSAKRNARTAMTGAENLGRNESFHYIKGKGIPCKLQWSATHDGRTREDHIRLDGTYQDDNGVFGADFLENPLRYPADPRGDGSEIYNCRCRASIKLDGVDHSQDGKKYEEFMEEQYPDDWEIVKKQRAEKEEQYQKNKKKYEEKRKRKGQK